MSLVLLYVLATLDGAFCGYRAAAGRSALIDKRRYYRRALLRGAGLAQIAVALVAVILVFLLAFSSAKPDLIDDLRASSRRALLVYGPYAVVALLAFGVRLLPSVDFRSATSVFVFGPLTALRPLVAFAGVVYAILPAAEVQTRLLGIMVLTLMFGVQLWLDRKAALEREASLPANPSI
ncbi:MAG TPA: hypothetical protein VKE93_08735 [Candidatus Angelobacter sp.]|nr:hypothetical protein [Candidatus Angelobacter sp.]